MQKKIFFGVYFFYEKKTGQRSVTAAWATRSPWSIFNKIAINQVHDLTQRFVQDKNTQRTQFYLNKGPELS